MKENTEILIHIVVVRIDESEYWDEELVAKAGKVYAYYLFDKSCVTYLCEMRGSYALYFIYNSIENTDNFTTPELEKIYDEGFFYKGDNDYIHKISYPSDYEEVRDDYCSRFTTEELKYYAQEENYDDFLERAVDFYRANWP